MDRQVDLIRQLRRQAAVGGTVGAVAYGIRELGLAYEEAKRLVRLARSNIVSGRTRSRYEQKFGGQNLSSRLDQVAEPMKKQKTVSGVPAVVPGGPGHYLGRFRKRKVPVGDSALTKIGAHEEAEIHGQIDNAHVQYFGVQSVTLPMISLSLCRAFVRAVWYREFGVVYPDNGDYLFINPGSGVPALKKPFYEYFVIKNRSRVSTGAWVAGEVTYGPMTLTTTVDDVALWLESLILTNNSFGASERNPEWDITGYQFVTVDIGDGGVTYSSVHPFRNIEQMKVRVSVKNIIHLQNTTPSDAGDLSRDRVDANPLFGKCYTMRGIYPVIEGNHGDDVGTIYNTFQTYDINKKYGIIIPNVLISGDLRSLPNPQMFQDIVKCETGLRLEPGDIKTDYLAFNYYGRFGDLLHGIPYNSAGVVSTSDLGRFGMCKLFGFEKVVPTGNDEVSMNYHIDRYINVVVDLGGEQPAVRRDHYSVEFNRKLLPV